MNPEIMIMETSMRNLLSIWYKKLTRQFPSSKIVPFILRAYDKLENGKSPVIVLNQRDNDDWNTSSNPDKTQSLIGINDGCVLLGWRLLVKKVTNNDFASAIPYPFAKSDVFNAAPAGADTEFNNIHGLLRYSELSLLVNRETILPGIPSEWFYDVPPVQLADAGEDATPQDGENFEQFRPIFEPFGFHGDVKTHIEISPGGNTNTIAGDATANPGEQNYVGVHAIGFKIQDGADVVKSMIDSQNRCALP